MNLYYRELGTETPPIIILHGVFGSCDNWLTVSKGLAEIHKVYLLDARNHGQSPHSDEFNYQVMAEDLHEFIQQHQLMNPILIGHSMGGKTVMKYAADYPNEFSKMIVVDISPRYYPPHHQSILEGLSAISLETLESRQEADDILKKFEPVLGVRQFLLKNLYRNEQNRFDWRMNFKIIKSKIENIGEALDESAKITRPTLFIRGANSTYIQERDTTLIKTIFSDVQIATVEGAGHWVQAEKPKEFLEVVKNFLEVNN
ncbi:MAG TPA: alpha/beta fold hydrolase [Cytophagaceae bacterium]|jgi:esterase|nr:alpha/beta fold hydrolase [Cytophagaceae bacterium]